MTRSLMVALLIVPAFAVEAQTRFRRPYAEGYGLGYGFDNDGGRGGCTDYACGSACYDGHTGEDFATPRGTQVRAGQSGTVSSTFNGCGNTGYVGNPCGGRCGNHVQIRHADGSHSIYCHMQLGSITVGTGASVSCGQVLGRSSSSGSSSGPHLHFGYRSPGGSSQEVFAGRCGRGSSLWVGQRGYREAPSTSCSACVPGRSESCNGADDDCDGRVDEGLRRGCGSDVGRCQRGTQTCSSGSWGSCAGEVAPRSERCDGVDDDCDGAVDDSLRRDCGSDVGECELGTETCASGAWSPCIGSVDPVPEQCDDLDNDCDGESDDEDVCEIEEIVLQGQVYGAESTDIDDDGRADACACGADRIECHLASGHGFEHEVPGPTFDPSDAGGTTTFDDISRFSTLRMGDIDGDGRADVCLRTTTGVRCWTASGSRAGFDAELEGPPLSDAAGFDSAPQYTTIRLADVDGDGMADLCARWPDGLRCYRATGHGFGEISLLPDLADESGFGDVAHYGTLRMGDIDGDGRADACARGEDGMRCWRSTGRSFAEVILGPAWRDDTGFERVEIWSTIRLVDVDGDGRADLCARTPSGFECHPSTGRGFGDPYLGPDLASADGWDDKSHYATIRLGDLDGDGQVDLCARGRGGVLCWLFTGRGFERRIDGPALGDAAGWNEPARFRTLRVADVNADGMADVCARDATGLRCWLSDGYGFPIEIPGPAWAEGWDAPVRFATIRLGGGGARDGEGSPLPPSEEASEAAGCSCRAAGAPASRGLWMFVALLVFSLRWRR